MNNLIKIEEKNGTNLVDARVLHQRLEVKRDFSSWIKERIEKYGFVENEDYFIENQVFPKNGENPLGGRPEINYSLTISMAKELCMVQNNDVGRSIRRYFIRIEKEYVQNRIVMPRPIVIEGLVECVSYEHWLLLHGYSCTSGAVRGRIRKHPEYFYKHCSGKWYMSAEYGQELLAYKQGRRAIKECQHIPTLKQLEMF